MRRAIVTGANGFIGKALVEALIERNYSVTALDGKRQTMRHAASKRRFSAAGLVTRSW